MAQAVCVAFLAIWKRNEAVVANFNTMFSRVTGDLADDWGKLRAQTSARWDELNNTMKKKDIVFRIDMSDPYDKKHIDDMRKRLERAFGGANQSQACKCPNTSLCKGQKVGNQANIMSTIANLYAVDATSPHRWWSESMLGYLAVQAKWKAEDCPPFHRRQLSRVFVWSPADLESPLGIKLVILHRLFGFNTYVIRRDDYQEIRNGLWPRQEFVTMRSQPEMENHFGLKEFVVWDGFSAEVATRDRGYRSHWSLLDADNPKRLHHQDRDGKQANTGGIMWRDYPDGEAECYLAFVKMLMENPRVINEPADFVNRADEWENQRSGLIFSIETDDSQEIEQILKNIAHISDST
jgi:hypothetical protein